MDFKPIVRFAVTSDVHYSEEAQFVRERFKNAMTSLYKHCQNQEYKNLDALYVVGDFACRSKRSEFQMFKDDCDAVVKDDTLLVVTMANHELHYGEGEEEALGFFAEIFNMPPDRHEVISGYHFISLTTTNNGGKWHDSFTSAKKEWLRTEIEKAIEDNKTRPIFVFQHPGVKDTTPGGSFGSCGLQVVLNDYPQVIDFSGHSHLSPCDPREIDQKEFTAIGTGSLNTIAIRCGGIHQDVTPERGFKSSDYAQLLVVEADANDTVRVRVYDSVNNIFMPEERIISGVHNKENFIYTDKRKETAPTPYFKDGAKAVLTVGETVKVEYDAAVCDGQKVWLYLVRLFGENGEVVAEKKMASDYMNYIQKDKFSTEFNDITEKVVSAEVYAVGFFENISKPIKTN